MDKKHALEVARRYGELLQSRFEITKIILFGSYSKGNPTMDSDIDIAVVFSDYDNRLDRQFELMKLTRQIDSRIEPHPFRESEFDISNPFVNEIVSYGTRVS
jgi:predicted nucleotidyltransferase